MPGHGFAKLMTGHELAGAPAKHLYRLARQASAAVLGLVLLAGQAAAWDRIPRPHEYRLSKPPGNIAAGDYKALFGGAVFVGFAGGRDNMPEHARDIIEVIYTGRNGRFAACVFRDPGKYYTHGNWRWKMDHEGLPNGKRRIPALINGGNISGRNGRLILPVYNGSNGELSMYRTYRKRWVDHAHGHLQKRLPRAVWTACPKFPSAKSLGIGVNEKQTATTYFDLVEQNKGQRIKRPDLVTRNPVEYLDKKTGKWVRRK